MRPIQYKTQFGRKRRNLYIAPSQVYKVFEEELVGNEWVVAWSTSLHTNLQLHKLYDFVSGDADYFRPYKISYGHGETQRKLVLRLCTLTAAVVLCLLPAKVSYTLSPFGITDFTSPAHKVLNVISFLNSCPNALIYWYHHKEHKRGSIKLFCTCKMLTVPGGGTPL